MIRRAGIEDVDRIIELLENFANAAPVDFYHNPQYNTQHVIRQLAEIHRAGIILVGEIEGEIEGMIIAKSCSDPWMPQIKIMREMAWWVEPNHRMGTIGYRLLKEYQKICKELVEQKKITAFTITTLTDSPIRDISHWGWRPIEQNYVYEEVA
jgi:hypothetical protein